MKTFRRSKSGKQRLEAKDARALVGRLGLAVALGVSLRTVDRMLAAGEIVPVRLRGWSVRFYVPEVVECLRNRNRKWGRKANLTEKTERRTSNIELWELNHRERREHRGGRREPETATSNVQRRTSNIELFKVKIRKLRPGPEEKPANYG